MLFEQINYIAVWYLNIFILGLFGLLVFKLVLPEIPTVRLYPFAKFFGLLTLSAVLWLVLYLTPLKLSFYVVLGVLLLLFTILVKTRHNHFNSTKSDLKRIFLFESIFFVIFLFALLYTSAYPDYTRPEDYMNFGFINSIVRSQEIPASDMWFSGHPINYYYFGHFTYAVLIVLSLVPVAIGYNLAFISIISMVSLMALGLLYLLTSKISYGLLASYFVTFSGNLYLWHILLRNGFLTAGDFDKAVGFVNKDINHFSSYTLWMGGFHANVFAIQNLMLYLVFVYYYLISPSTKKHSVITGIFLGVAFISNSWDMSGVLLLWSLAFIVKNIANLREFSSLGTLLVSYLKNLLIVLVTALVFISPYLLTSHLGSVTSGIAFSPFGSGLYNIFLMFGVFLVPILGWLVSFMYTKTSIFAEKHNSFIFILVLSALVLIILPDIVYVRDIYFTENPDYIRANTVYKMWFQAWILLCIATPLIFAKISKTRIKISIISVAVLLSLIYPTYLFASQFLEAKNLDLTSMTLDGTQYLLAENQDYYHALNFINTLPSDSVILEPFGEQYGDYDSMFSAYSGHPTVLGWYYHEKVWRGSLDEITLRFNDIETIYTSDDPQIVLDILQKYSIDYFVVSPEIAERYSDANYKVLQGFGEIVFTTPSVTIYRVDIKSLPPHIS